MSSLLTNSEGKAFDLPESLRSRCTKLYGWNEDFASKAIHGYLQFIKLKLQQEDWHACVLSPSRIVEQVWHQHILHVEHYVKACHDYTAGHLIGHNPDNDDDTINSTAELERIMATQLSLKALFGRADVDPEIWAFGGEEVFDAGDVSVVDVSLSDIIAHKERGLLGRLLGRATTDPVVVVEGSPTNEEDGERNQPQAPCFNFCFPSSR